MNLKLLGGSLLNYVFNNLITHIPNHFFRKAFLRAFNRNIHSTSVVLMHVRVLNFWNLRIAERVVINQYCLLDCRRHEISIDHDSDIGPYTRIWTIGHDPDSEKHDLYGGPVKIGHHVWIASGAIVLPDLYLADGTVVAAGTVVHKNTSPNDIIAGNPGKLIRKRNNSLTYRLTYKPIFE